MNIKINDNRGGKPISELVLKFGDVVFGMHSKALFMYTSHGDFVDLATGDVKSKAVMGGNWLVVEGTFEVTIP